MQTYVQMEAERLLLQHNTENREEGNGITLTEARIESTRR